MPRYDVADMPNPKRCYLCQERGRLGVGIRPYGKPYHEVWRAPEKDDPDQSEGETYKGVCDSCAEGIIDGARDEGIEWVLIGYVP